MGNQCMFGCLGYIATSTEWRTCPEVNHDTKHLSDASRILSRGFCLLCIHQQPVPIPRVHNMQRTEENCHITG
jgi:hypothetical protein